MGLFYSKKKVLQKKPKKPLSPKQLAQRKAASEASAKARSRTNKTKKVVLKTIGKMFDEDKYDLMSRLNSSGIDIIIQEEEIL